MMICVVVFVVVCTTSMAVGQIQSILKLLIFGLKILHYTADNCYSM